MVSCCRGALSSTLAEKGTRGSSRMATRSKLGLEDGKRVRSKSKITLRRYNYSEFNIHVVSWNVASFMPSASEVESLFLPQEGFMVPGLFNNTDLLVVGLQEAYQKVQDTFTSSIPVVGRDPHVEAFNDILARKGFVRLAACRLLGILIIVYVKQPLLCYIHSVASCTTKTGFSGWVGNKGAASVRFTLGDVSFCFTNCHLAPHYENNDRRVMELKDIFSTQFFESKRLPLLGLVDHDVLVLFGDLNFRLEKQDFAEVCHLLDTGNLEDLLSLDQLRLEQIKGNENGSNLPYFVEMSIDFQPSYKYAPGTDRFNEGGKTRTPAWCDRILWKIHERRFPKITDAEPRSIIQQKYYCVHVLPRLSDHKAVSAGLKASVDISRFNPLIIFHLSEWICGVQGVIELMVSAETEVSMWDWIGLYPAKFSSLERESVLWVRTPAPYGHEHCERVFSRSLSPSQVPSIPGRYLLVYKSSHYNRVLGMSPIFRIRAQESWCKHFPFTFTSQLVIYLHIREFFPFIHLACYIHLLVCILHCYCYFQKAFGEET